MISMLMFFGVVCTMDKVCDPIVVTGQNGTCYRGGVTVFENHQMCNVTSKFCHILDIRRIARQGM